MTQARSVFGSWLTWLVFWLFAVAGGVVASWVFWQAVAQPQLAAVNSRLDAAMARPATTSTVVETPQVAIPSVRAPQTPAVLLNRRSSVAKLRARVPSGKGFTEQLLGSAVALSSDGWFLTTASAIRGSKVAELQLVIDGKTYQVVQGLRDTFTDLAYLKTLAANQTPADFLRAEDAVAGMAVYVEPSARRLYPDVLVDVRLQATTSSWSPDMVMRRMLIGTQAAAAWKGSAVWDQEGRLVGLLEAQSQEGWNVVPAAHALSALSSVFDGKVLMHATLGGRVVSAEGTGSALGAVSVADKKGMAPSFAVGDVIERVERDILDGTADIGERLLAYRPGSQVVLYGRRKAEAMEWPVTLGSATGSEAIK